jgi:hypothetical protein
MTRLAHLPRVRRLRRRALAAAMAGVPLLTSGCGPSVPVQLGMKNVPLDITVGNDVPTRPPVARGGVTAPPVAEALPAVAPLITAVAPPAAPGFTPPPPLVVGSGEVCPQLDHTRASPGAATAEVDSTATQGAWPFRSGGEVTVDGVAYALPPQNTRSVSAAAQSSQGVFDFTETGDSFGFPGAQTAYTASNSTSAPANPLVSPTSSFGLSSFLLQFPGGALAFHPATPLKLLATPASAASTYQPDPNNPSIPDTTGSWNDAQSDAQDGSAMSIQATDLGKVQVNACGTPVDAWRVHAVLTLTGTLIATTAGPVAAKTDLTLDVTYAVATGLGGLIVDEVVKTVANSDGSTPSFAGAAFTDNTTSTLSAPRPEPS